MAGARGIQTPSSMRAVGLLAGVIAFLAIILSPLEASLGDQGQAVAAIAVLMAIWWMTEALPIPVTSLLPLLLYPLFGVMPVHQAASPYAHHLVFLFLGGFVLALAVERSGLHRRIALRIIFIVGEGSGRLVLGFMLATALLSMWISNTATVMLMLPIALAVIEQRRSTTEDAGHGRFAIALLLGLAYSASIGGVATLIGTPPNIVLAGVLTQMYPDAPPIGFVQWMSFGVPLAALFLPLSWLLLVRVFPATRIHHLPTSGKGRAQIRQDLLALGKLTRTEKQVLAVFLLTAAGWIFRAPIELGAIRIPGLTDLIPMLSDTGIAIAAAVMLFLLPGKERGMLLSWPEIQRGIPWGILLLFGGGFALAAGMQQSGVTLRIGELLTQLQGMPLILMILLTCLLLTFLTELTSNTATASILIPVMAAAAITLGQNPLLLMLPAALNASFAFMLPVATPPNAIVFSSAWLDIRTMAKTGFTLNLLGVVLVTALMYLLGMGIFAIAVDAVPPWAF